MSARKLLTPLTPLYRLGLAWRERRLASGREAVRRLTWPVISIGNLSTGGAGKTPLAIALARALAGRGWQVDVLSRGYGGRTLGAARVRLEGSAEEFGDEPLVIAREAGVPVYVAAERYEAGMLAERELGGDACDVHILDDGFQHRQLRRDLDILLVNQRDWRDRLLPAGNLREPLEAARRADVIAVPEGEPELETELRGWGWKGPVWRLRRRMEVSPVEGPVVAFCGIARPEQFLLGLEQDGLKLADCRVFGDHHRYSERDLARLVKLARRVGARALVTTEKDAVRLAGMAPGMPVLTVGLRVEILDEGAAMEWLIKRIPPKLMTLELR
jgi:tetraacyldisaccharide 4'-kinase